MKGQTQVWVWGEGGERLAVLSGPEVDASFDIIHFIEDCGRVVYDYFANQTALQRDLEAALSDLLGDVKAEGEEHEAFSQGGGLYNGDPRLASCAEVFFHAWTGDDIKPSHGFSEPPTPTPGVIDLGEVRYTRGDFQYEYRFLLQFSLLDAGQHAFSFATGDSGWFDDATIGYTVTVQIDPPAQPWPSIQQKHDDLVANNWFSFGDPATDEMVAPDGVGHYRHYQNGSLYWSPGRGAHLVYGAIRAKWAELGWELGFGYPLTDEIGTPDGIGRFNHFQSASIYWTPSVGAHEVHGAIRARWAELGWERSYLGYPITDEIAVPNDPAETRYSNFQRGSIRWTPTTGAIDYHAPVQNAAIAAVLKAAS
jgi:hypothetical protein